MIAECVMVATLTWIAQVFVMVHLQMMHVAYVVVKIIV